MTVAVPQRRIRDLPADPGTYVLILRAPRAARVAIGRLGTLDLLRGYYAYVGSALGPGGLRARLCHHLAPARRPHWHIDRLREHACVVDIWHATGTDRREHAWAAILARRSAESPPLAGFGSSDCDCTSHLFRFARRPRLEDFGELR